LSTRTNILARIRAAQGSAATASPDERATVISYLGAHPPGPRPRVEGELVNRFRERVLALASTFDEARSLAEAPRMTSEYLHRGGLPRAAVCWPELSVLPWAAAGLAVEARPARGDDLVGITGAYCAIAETGTLMLLSAAATPAATSLLPETHIAVVAARRLVRTMEDAWQLLRAEHGMLPRAVNFISGPSRTADIEQTLTLGAHGPYRVHVILVHD
jgi:L-lactate dehydrogenase complex protein LldG